MNALRTPTRALGERDDNVRQPNTQKPRRKEKPSAMCKTPPSLIQNLKGQSYTRGSCIGEGGFARCFQVNSRGDGAIYAAKTIAKTTLKNEKTKTKLLAEIKIHRAMNHSNIVHFVDCFEDDVNVYILLEMCSNQSLLDMVRARQRLTETESRFFMVQLLGAVNYMHSRLVIHRDLKLGNVFIDEKMNLKIGDFGLAARLENSCQRRYTICGTPNYIAPELLIGNHEHTFSTDIWALGIILYAMLFNRPPFQEKDVNVIYERIKRGDLRFPSEHSASPEAVELIRMMLAANPSSRPSITEVLDHRWFNNEFPAKIPSYALNRAPTFYLSPVDSQLNFVTIKIASGLVMKQPHQPSIEPVTKADVSDEHHVLPATLSPPSTRDKYRVVMVNKGNEGDAPVHDSPIVNRNRRSARTVYPQDRENQWSKAVPAVRTSTTQDLPATNAPMRSREQYQHQQQHQQQQRRRPRPLSALVGGVASAASAAGAAASMAMRNNFDDLKRTSSTARSSSGGSSSSRNSFANNRRDVAGAINNSLQSTHQNLVQAITAFNNKTLSCKYHSNVTKPIYLTKWADFTEIWGLAYGLNDGAIGMKFRDNTSIRYDPIHKTFMYYTPCENGYTQAQQVLMKTPDISKKVDAINFSYQYMEERLGHSSADHRSRTDSSDGIFVEKFDRNQNYMMFVLSDGTVQFNFHDHNKVVLFDNGHYVHIITAQREEHTMSLNECVLKSRELSYLKLTQKIEEIVQVIGSMA